MIWQSDHQAEIEPPFGWGWVRLGFRLMLIAFVMFALLGPVLLARLVGWRRVAERIVQFACKLVIKIMRFRLHVEGTPLSDAGLIVANHTSWLDIFVSNAAVPVVFVAKSEVKTWPMIGIFARAVGTEFIIRKRTRTATQKDVLMNRMENGDRLLLFPEGTSTDRQRILPFKSGLFGALHDPHSKVYFPVQTLAMCYFAPPKKRKDFYGWYGGMGFKESFFEILAAKKNGDIYLTFGQVLDMRGFSDRKKLTKYLEQELGKKFDEVRAANLNL